MPLFSSSPSFKLLVYLTARLVAVHRALLVPMLWMAKVKANLDRDVVLGVLEKVPENTPVMWQSHMHVVPKKTCHADFTVDLHSTP